MAAKKQERKLTHDEQVAEDEAHGDLPDGKIMLVNDSGNVKKVDPEEWDNEERQAELLRQGWKVVGEDDE